MGSVHAISPTEDCNSLSLAVAIHMDMGRLVRLMAVKIHAVWPHHQYGWHAFQYLTVVRRILAALSCPSAVGRSGGYPSKARSTFLYPWRQGRIHRPECCSWPV